MAESSDVPEDLRGEEEGGEGQGERRRGQGQDEKSGKEGDDVEGALVGSDGLKETRQRHGSGYGELFICVHVVDLEVRGDVACGVCM